MDLERDRDRVRGRVVRAGAAAAIGAVALAAVIAMAGGEAKAAERPTPQASGAPPGGGGGGPDIRAVQREAQGYLSSLGYVAGNGKPLAADGVLGPLTCGAARFVAAYFGDKQLSDDLIAVANSCGAGKAPQKAGGAAPPPAPASPATIKQLSDDLDTLLNTSVGTCEGIADQIQQLVAAGGEPTDAQWAAYSQQCGGDVA